MFKVKTADSKQRSKLSPELQVHWDDAYHLLKDRAQAPEEEAKSFADAKVRSIQNLERQFAHSRE